VNDCSKLLQHLSVTHFCDVYPKIRVLSASIFPITQKHRILGRAFTVKAFGSAHNLLRALSHTKKHDVLIVHTEKTIKALGGEIYATIAKRQKLAGIIIDGSCRDPDGICAANIPFYARAIYPVVARSKKIGQWQKVITCGGVKVYPGDIIFGDRSGIIVLSLKEFRRLLPLALNAVQKELGIFANLKRGLSLPKVFSWIDFD